MAKQIKLSLVSLLCMGIFFISMPQAFAQGIAETAGLPTAAPMSATCDAGVMVAMEVRAWLEAQREITQNQNLIAKPDSVMEYTCFDSFLDVLAAQASNMFSENTGVWSGSVGIITEGDMDTALTELIGNPMQEYITTNFSHSFVGGRASIDSTLTLPVAGAAYACDQMSLVWQQAKCMNFATRPEDGFLTFSQHADNEVRAGLDGILDCEGSVKYPTYPNNFADQEWKNAGTPTYNANIQSSYDTMAEYTEVGDCSAERSISTGLTVFNEGTPTPDTVCLNPGCYYNGSACAAY